MSQRISLKGAERKVFNLAVNDGLWDILMGCFFLIFAIAPLLSNTLGDYWSSAVFLPFWLLVYLIVRWIRKHMVIPRIGVVKFGRVRQTRLRKFTISMLVVNIIAAILGVVAFMSFGGVAGQVYTMTLGLIFLIGFSTAAYILNINRLFVYGLLAGLSFLVGELLWVNGYASHHGLPITFGLTSGLMILVGLALFIRLLRNNPVLPMPVESNSPDER